MATSSFQPTSCPDIKIALSTENIVPLYVPLTRQVKDDSYIAKLLAQGAPSPRTARTFLENYGENLSTQDAVTMAKKLAQLAADREVATNMCVRHLNNLAQVASQEYLEQTCEMENALTKLKERLAELESRLADSDSPILPLAPHCPPDFTQNVGLVPDFYIYEDGMRLLARYVYRVPGTNIAQGSLGGQGSRIHTHVLQALPSIVSDTPPDVLPLWFTQSMGSNSPAFQTLAAEAERLGDWGLAADIYYYHDTDVRLEEVQSLLRELQAEADTLGMQRRAAHYRLARADAGTRLAAVEAISPFFQEGSVEGRAGRGKTRGRVFGK